MNEIPKSISAEHTPPITQYFTADSETNGFLLIIPTRMYPTKETVSNARYSERKSFAFIANKHPTTLVITRKYTLKFASLCEP